MLLARSLMKATCSSCTGFRRNTFSLAKKENERGHKYGTMATDIVLHGTRQTSQVLAFSQDSVFKSGD